MSKYTTYDGGSFQITISPDGLTATLHLEPRIDAQPAAVIAKAKAIGLKGLNDAEIATSLQHRQSAALSLVIARGVAATDERAGRVELLIPLSDTTNGLIAKVSAGQPIATVAAAAPGTDGKDVFGETIAHQKSSGPAMGTGVSLVNGSITATIAGNARAQDGGVGVFPLLEIAADHDSVKAPIQFDGDIVVKGGVSDGATLSATGCVIIGGAIEAATVQVGGWLVVKGGIVGHAKGSVTVGGDLWCRFVSHAKISAGGNMHVVSEVANSHVACSGKLTIVGGSIYGGETIANGGVECHSLGNNAATKTVVEAGTDQNVRSRLIEARSDLDLRQKRVADIRQKIAPLMKLAKQLTAQQREKAFELLYEADEMEGEIEAKLTALSESCRATAGRAHAEVKVAENVFAGVVVRLPGMESPIQTALHGPLSLIPHKIGSRTVICVKGATGHANPLPTTPLVDPVKPFVDRFAAIAKAA